MRLSPPLSTPLRIAAATLWLPDRRETTEAALAAGRVDEETAARLRYREVAVSRDHAAPEMAVLAATDALAAAGWDGSDLGMVAHAWTYHQGHDFWSPAHYVAHRIGASAANAVGVQQMCNGGAAALEVAAARMIADPGVARAAVTTGDRFPPPAFDRWLGDYELVYGDSGTALLLDRTQGPYELLSVATVARSEYETMHRGDDEFSSMPRTLPQVDVRRTKRAFIASGAEPGFDAALVEAVVEVVGAALTEAGLAPDDPAVRFLTLPGWAPDRWRSSSGRPSTASGCATPRSSTWAAGPGTWAPGTPSPTWPPCTPRSGSPGARWRCCSAWAAGSAGRAWPCGR